MPLQNWLGVTIAALLIGAIIVVPLARWRPTWLLAVSLIGIIAPIAILGRDNPLWPTASFSGVGGGMLAGILAQRWITRNVPLTGLPGLTGIGNHWAHVRLASGGAGCAWTAAASKGGTAALHAVPATNGGVGGVTGELGHLAKSSDNVAFQGIAGSSVGGG